MTRSNGINTKICQIKEFKGALPGLRQSLAAESLFKIMKNAVHFSSKDLFAYKIFKTLIDLLVIYKNRLIRRIRLISKSMTSEPG